MSDLPEGFVIDTPPAADTLPEGFVVDATPKERAKKSYDLGAVPAAAATNFIPSLLDNLKSMVDGVSGALSSPVETGKTLLKLGTSVAPGMSEVQTLLKKGAALVGPEAAASVEAALKDWNAPKAALVKEYVDKYGGWDEAKRTVAEDPAGFLMDLSMVLSPAAGLKNAPGLTGKVARAASGASDVLDPVTMAGKGVGLAGKAGAELLGVSTGAGAQAIKEAARTGLEGGQAGIDFRKALAEGATTEDVVELARQGTRNMKDSAMRIYEARKNDPKHGWSNDATQLPFQPISDAWKDLVDSLTTKKGQRTVGDTEWNAIQKVGEVVSEWEKNPTLRTADDFDGLKRRIQAIYPDGVQPQLQRAVTKMANAVKRVMNDPQHGVPGYMRAMRDYHTAMDSLDELEKAFSLGQRSSMQTAMSKLQSVMRNNANTSYGLRDAKARQLRDEGGVDILPTLAGHALSSPTPRGIARGVAGGVAPFALTSALTTGGISLPAIGAGALGMAASSPKVVGSTVHNAARAAAMPGRLERKMKLPEGSFAAPFSRLSRNAYRAIDAIDDNLEEDRFARGGHFNRRRSC